MYRQRCCVLCNYAISCAARIQLQMRAWLASSPLIACVCVCVVPAIRAGMRVCGRGGKVGGGGHYVTT